MKLDGTREGVYRWCGYTHMCINVEGGLKAFNKKTLPHLYTACLKGQREGHKVIPVGECDNFSYEDGCQGHTTYVLFHDWKWEEGNG